MTARQSYIPLCYLKQTYFMVFGYMYVSVCAQGIFLFLLVSGDRSQIAQAYLKFILWLRIAFTS